MESNRPGQRRGVRGNMEEILFDYGLMMTSPSQSSDEESAESDDEDDEPVDLPTPDGEDKKRPEVGGFDHEFIDDVLPAQKCAVCLLPMREAVQTAKCGHRFCCTCLKKSIRKNNSVCPTCRDLINPSDGFYHDIAWSRDILSLRVKCQMSGRGCEWTGEVRHAEEHQVECLFADETCGRCEAYFERRHQQIHHKEQCPYRVVECAFCKEFLSFNIKPEHEGKDCLRFPLLCKNRCGLTDIPREDMEDHLSDHCPMTEVVCPYIEAGCVFEDKRAYLNEHIEASNEHHMKLLLTSLQDTKQKLPELEEELKILKKSEAKKSQEAANLAHTVKELEVDKMRTNAELERCLKRVQSLEENFESIFQKKRRRMFQPRKACFHVEDRVILPTSFSPSLFSSPSIPSPISPK